MLRPYFCAYHSYLENMELLNSEERGRLFTALLEYSKDGTLIPLTGNERFVFPGIRSQIDRDKWRWVIKSMAIKMKHTDKDGTWTHCTVSVTLMEYLAQ